MTKLEIVESIQRGSWATGETLNNRDICYLNEEANCILLKWPETVLSVPYYARTTAMLGHDEESLFDGALLWITLHNIGSPQIEKSGWQMVERMRQGFGENRPLSIAPGHWFRDDELVTLAAFIVPCFIYGWDAFVVPNNNACFAFICHDEYWCVVTRTEERHTELSAKLADFSQPAFPNLLRRFCPNSRALAK